MKDPKIKGYKKQKCRLCKTIVDRVDATAKSVLCWKCTHLYTEGHSFEDISEMLDTERNKFFER